MRTIVAFAVFVITLTSSHARADDTPKPQPLIVAVNHYPPAIIKEADGNWSGTFVEFWKHVADSVGWSYTFKEVDPKEVSAKGPDAVGVDVVLGVGITARIEKLMDVSAPFVVTGLGIATRPEPASAVDRIAGKVFSWRFLRNLSVLLLAIVIVGVIVWRIERETSPEEFGGKPLTGIGGGIFWTVESLFARPKPLSRRLRSRLVALFWVIVCMVLISGLTAKLSAEFTVSQLSGTVSGVRDLDHARVGAVVGSNGMKSVGAKWLEAHGIPYRPFVSDSSAKSLSLALDALEKGELDAVVDGVVNMQYVISKEHPGRLLVLPDSIQAVPVAFGLRLGSPIRKQLNQALLRLAEAGDYKQILRQYVGRVQD